VVDAPAGLCGVVTRLVAALGTAGDTGDDDVTAAVFPAPDVGPVDGLDGVAAVDDPAPVVLVDEEAPDKVEFCEVVAPEPDAAVAEPELPDGRTFPGSVPLVAIPPVGVRIWALAGAPSATERTTAIGNARAMSGP
jgi:hypothetical protein